MKKNYNLKDYPTILIKFIKYLENVMNYSPKTIESYLIDLMLFFRFIKEYNDLEIDIKEFNVFILAQIKESDVIAFLVYTNYNRDNAASTRQRKKASIKCFFKWLFNNYPSNDNWINPTNNLPSIIQTKRIPKHLTLSQAKNISQIFTIHNSIYPNRNNMIITLFLNTGLRVSELSNLNISDINFSEKYIKIIGKGNKESKVLINEKLKEKLLDYINKNVVKDSNSPLFMSRLHKRLSVREIEEICKNAYKFAGIGDRGYTAHTLRHTFGTIMYKQVNGDIFLLKEIMRHESIVATERYVHIDNEEIRNAFNNNPLNESQIA